MPRPTAEAWAAFALLAAAILLRLPSFGDPALDVDEQFYLLVGDRMLHGAIPYVDIWDRKPIGLFLLYAGLRLLGGGVWPYQIAAALFAGGTAGIIFAIARRPAGLLGAFAAGLSYLVWIETMGGDGGQSPVFYNLFVAAAGWCTLRALGAPQTSDGRRSAFAAMALAGIAIQIKYTALFEGLGFGLMLAWSVARGPAPRATQLATVAALATAALLPTILATGAYAAIGHLHAFWFANFVSIFHRTPTPPAELRARLAQIALHLLPLGACIAGSAWSMRNARAEADRRWCGFVVVWLVAATAGFFSVGALYIHYALPLFVPFSIAAAPCFRRRPIGPGIAALVIWIPVSHLGWPDFAATAASQRRIAALTALVPPGVRTGCLHMFAGPPALYRLTNACFVSRYVFPDHLVGARDTGAIGADQVAETIRVFDRAPLVIVTDDATHDTPRNPASMAALRHLRDARYQRVGAVAIDGAMCTVWVRR